MRKDRGIPYIYNADSQNVLQSIWKEKPWLRQPNEGSLEVKEVHGVFWVAPQIVALCMEWGLMQKNLEFLSSAACTQQLWI